MGSIVDFRQTIIDYLKNNVEELREVSWYDGLFDEHDVKDWVLQTPSAWVAIQRAPTEPTSTGELNAPLTVSVVVVVEDRMYPRDADPACWDIVEKIALLAQNNAFGVANAAPATKIMFERIRDPELRRNGVALGVAEWETGLMIGTDKVRQREFPRDPVTHQMMPTPRDLILGTGTVYRPDGVRSAPETLNITPDDE